MKKKLFAVAVIAICLSILAYSSLAYFTAEGTATNVITTGGVDIQVEEFQQVGGELKPYPTDKPITIMPGTTVSKIVTVKNLEARSYIRASMELVVLDPQDQVMELSAEDMARLFTIAVNTEAWQQKEGATQWWYYNEVVETGISTKPFFSEVVFDGPNMTNEYQNCTIKVLVTAQAVQADNNGDSVLEAAGWEETK